MIRLHLYMTSLHYIYRKTWKESDLCSHGLDKIYRKTGRKVIVYPPKFMTNYTCILYKSIIVHAIHYTHALYISSPFLFVNSKKFYVHNMWSDLVSGSGLMTPIKTCHILHKNTEPNSLQRELEPFQPTPCNGIEKWYIT